MLNAAIAAKCSTLSDVAKFSQIQRIVTPMRDNAVLGAAMSRSIQPCAKSNPNIETYVYLTNGAFLEGDLAAMPDGPTLVQREGNRYHAVVEVTGEDGRLARSILETVGGYTFTAIAAAEAARRVWNGEARPGFQTPAGLFGDGFAETIADTSIVDV